MNPELSPQDQQPTQKEPTGGKRNIFFVFCGFFILVIGIGVGYLIHKAPESTSQSLQYSQNSSNTHAIPTTTQQVSVRSQQVQQHAHKALPLGDQKYTSSPKIGYIYLCRMQTDGNAGAYKAGPWINQQAGTWDLTKKISVHGTVSWANAKWSVTDNGATRVLSGNGLPSHTTGVYPIQSTDDAYAYDRNPNSIQEQSLTINLPTNPTMLSTPDCVGGEVGIMLSGVPLFNGFDAGGRDADAWEIQDDCSGHPQVSGMYHYHGPSKCLKDTSAANEHSSLVGYALDGFGIFGVKGEGGKELSTQDLDECHGHTHEIIWDGKKVSLYHYHLTYDFPYSVGCFRAQKAVNGPLGSGGQNFNSQHQLMPSGQYPPPMMRPLNAQPPQGF